MKNFKRLVSLFLAFVILICMTPLTIFAAPASDIPAEMLDNVFLDALEYTGYKVQTQKDNGTIFKQYSNSAPASVRSNISYGTGPSGLETVSNLNTATGLAPDIAKFEQSGLCCASYVSYVYYNYLPNIAGIDTSGTPAPSNPRAAVAYKNAADSWIASGIARSIPFTQNTDGSGFSSSESIPIGSLIAFKSISSGTIAHVAIYAGYYNGEHFITHVGSDNGPEFCTISGMTKGGSPQAVVLISAPEFVESNGAIEVFKKDTDGNNLSGAVFVAINDTTGEQYKIGPTNINGYAISDDAIPYGNYTVKETVFPTNYKEHGQTEWKVKVGSDNKGVVTINAINEIISGNIEIVKKSEDSVVDGISFRITGNGVYKTVTTANGGKVKVNDLKPGVYTVTEETLSKYEPQESQKVTLISGKTSTVNFSNTLKRGSLKVIKTSEDGFVENIKFKLTGTSLSGEKIEQYAVTNKKGIATFTDVLISGKVKYTLSEVDTANWYEVPESQSVTVEWNEVAEVSVCNKLKRGSLRVTKSSEDGFVQGMKFKLTGTSNSGIKVDEYATTNTNGIAVFDDILIGQNYTLQEMNTPVRYVIPSKQTVDVEWNTVTSASVNNILKKWRVKVYKVDKTFSALSSPYSKTQGDATLEGAVYGIYKNGSLVDTYTTDKSGCFITKYYPCGDDNKWTVKEIASSEGYIVDPTEYTIDTQPGNYTVELNTENLDVFEEITSGKISIIKHADDGSTQIEHPEENAEFEVYLKSAGSYKEAKETEKALLVTDEYGYAETREWLPYGIYTVKQTKGLAGKELMPEFDININEDKRIYRYLINNDTFDAEIEIVKKDAETGKIIPASGIGFKVLNTDTGEFVVQHLSYPTPMAIEIYYTDSSGKLMLPYAIPYGNYEIIEQNTCYGYVLDSTPVPFFVDETDSLITVEKLNYAQKGTIIVSKNGEVFSSVIENDGIYQPVYESKGLEGAVYEVIATEDVITLDGTKRYSQGDVVATVTTDENGTAVTEPLCLGKYEIHEIKAPYGMVLNTNPINVELTYAGEHISITETSALFINERQKFVIGLEKKMECDEIFNIGFNGEITNVQFGLYAAKDLTAADGKIIPKDALLETAYCNKNGTIEFKTDIPINSDLYVKELKTDHQYVLSEEIFEAEFQYAGQETKTVHNVVNAGEAIENRILRGYIAGKKIDEDGKAVCGAVFGLFYIDETEFTEKTALLTAETDENGIFGFENVPYIKGLVCEIKADESYVLNEDKFEVTIAEDGEIIEIEVENKFITGTVQTTKVDEEYPENKLSGAEFEIYLDTDGNKEFKAEIDQLVGKMTEGENGTYCFDKLRYNGYFLHEKTAPIGFLKDDGYYYFEIRVNGETVTVENIAGVGFANKAIEGSVTATKVDSEYPHNKLSGAVFEVYEDTDRNSEYSLETDLLIGELAENENGAYGLDDIRYGGYFLYEKSAPEGFLKDNNNYYFEISNSGETVNIETEAGKGFINKPIKGELVILKTDKDDGKPIEGVGFRVKDMNGNVVAEDYTNAEGIVKFTLRYGKYTYEEIKTPYEYKLNDTVHECEITENGMMVYAEVKNVRIDVPTVPKTGDNSKIGFWIGLAAVALGGVISCGIMALKSKNGQFDNGDDDE